MTNTLGVVGWMSGSDGTATVSGAGSTWTNSSTLSVGMRSIGRLDITGGGSVSSTDGSLGIFAGGDGTITVGGQTLTVQQNGRKKK